MTGADEITQFPKILQLVLLGLLALYVLVSIVGRLSWRFEWLWADPDEARSLGHVLTYTVVPALVLLGAVAAVVANWNPAATLTGGWTTRQLTLGPGLALLGMILIPLATLAQRAREDAVHPAPAWIPPVMMLVGIALLAVGVLTFGRTVKAMKHARPGTLFRDDARVLDEPPGRLRSRFGPARVGRPHRARRQSA